MQAALRIASAASSGLARGEAREASAAARRRAGAMPIQVCPCGRQTPKRATANAAVRARRTSEQRAACRALRGHAGERSCGGGAPMAAAGSRRRIYVRMRQSESLTRIGARAPLPLTHVGALHAAPRILLPPPLTYTPTPIPSLSARRPQCRLS